jgi:elongation factor Ts
MIDGNDAELAKDLAMHVAASKPEYLSTSDVPQEIIKEEARILTLQAEEEGKPKEIVEKIVQGKLKKQFDQVSLFGQEFVKDPDMTIDQLLAKKNASVKSFVRYEVGEGIEVEEVNFADEVKAQVDATK